MIKKVLIPIIAGNEEIETSCIYSILSRAGNKVTLSKCNLNNESSLNVKLSRGLNIKANCFLSSDMKDKFDLVVLPGGLAGAKNYNKCEMLKEMLRYRKEKGLLYGGICATPGVFLAKNKLLSTKGTCFPTFMNIVMENGYLYENKPFVIDRNVLTGRGAGDAMTYALNLVKIINGVNSYYNVKRGLLL